MDKMQKLQLMDKIIRELNDLSNSQTSVLKKVAQIEADNINLGVQLLEKVLPDVHEKIDESVTVINGLVSDFSAYRDKFYSDNDLASIIDPTA